MSPLPMIDGIEPILPGRFPVLPLRDIVVFPQLILPLFVGREKSVRAVEHALETDRFVFLAAQRDLKVDSPTPEDIYSVGTVGLITRMIRVKEGNKMKVLVQGICKAEVMEFVQTEPFFIASLEKKAIEKSERRIQATECLIRDVKEKLDKLIFAHGEKIPVDIMVVIENLEDPERLAHLIAGNVGLSVSQAQGILEIADPIQKLKCVDGILDRLIMQHGDLQ